MIVIITIILLNNPFEEYFYKILLSYIVLFVKFYYKYKIINIKFENNGIAPGIILGFSLFNLLVIHCSNIKYYIF